MAKTKNSPKLTVDESRRIATTGDIEVATYLQIAKKMGGEQPSPARETISLERESIVVIDFGSQYSLLIARRVRECNVYCELVSCDTPWEKIAPLNPKGFILSGGPASVYQPNAPLAPAYIYESHLPVLGICYGMQVITQQLGGQVTSGIKQEYGHAVLHLSDSKSPLFAGLDNSVPVWMSHGDRIEVMPPGFKAVAHTENTPVAVMGNDQGIYGLQFHPEVAHTPQGKILLKNFVCQICGCGGIWTMGSFINESIARIREQVGTGKVITALSGGVDSAVVATLIHRAVSSQLTCIFVDNGLLRREEVERTFKVFQANLGLNIIGVDASERFMKKLQGVIDPEEKRKVIGEEFIHVFEEEANKIGKVDFLAQGTLYPDVIESATSGSTASAKIKTHHNVGGLPAKMKLTLIEPLRHLFKDEVRKVGLELGMPQEMVWRQPFPGPGLAIRVIGEVTKEKLEILRSVDFIVMNEIKKANFYRQLWQSFAVLTDVKSVGVQGDYRTYSYLVAIRAVTSEDAMTADWARLPYDLLARLSTRIANEVPSINRVVYDITSKPPSTIEWE
ncbi:MAG: glutamine-hydrolyzing GMP synthase [Dehalococcoidales bacterium]|jgi:GMP synthase (glutamine-hydrolysing)|nr:glutamine-hydrolyzing GMP synthase [Dehalococcoidales bacterium]MDP7109489.1 glutamine-hydrolyzing GMP synthase [Dehalococcoidales bacterium]MDP7310428.1 glutamine-hydrolyzing GMP synthase [Dehalococcoidales bacterium]MDP7410051.1 glutamine-hydrolyzing GMP synthase [Dehalococcoidales bacterium]MDP7676078.1 glutamine-hydrolyzing GMP synthase [Dehalococcoidales bacterium]|tara:strand:+ start:990 stop:2678 length:1689 start_codon:yes stop_codon:yes gene_type:complete